MPEVTPVSQVSSHGRADGADVVLTSVIYLYLCQPSFPEGPERLHAIKEQLIQEGLLDRCVSFQVSLPVSILGGRQWLREGPGHSQSRALCLSLVSLGPIRRKGGADVGSQVKV